MAAVGTHATCMDCGGLLSRHGMPAACNLTQQQQVAPQQQPHNGAGEGAVEMDPNKRYIRYPVLLGRGACKRVYKAFDLVEGLEVAWNKAELAGRDMDPEQQERLFSEIRVLKTLKHRNIITCHDWWHDASTQTINFITEYFTSGTLRQYRKKHQRHISEMAMKRWAFQILEGLLYLHAHSPPIVHRDLKCDNILVNGTSGQVKIADLGLASCQRGLSVVGTPEFMAPEMYDEEYDEKVDIYAFGMCMLELATLEYPYSECRSIPAIFRKVSQGIPPAALTKVLSPSLKELITTCINPDPQQRPGALQLLKHAFFADLSERPPGSPSHATVSAGKLSSSTSIPFGSCGNLMALPHGSVTQHLSHSSSQNDSTGVSRATSRCNSMGLGSASGNAGTAMVVPAGAVTAPASNGCSISLRHGRQQSIPDEHGSLKSPAGSTSSGAAASTQLGAATQTQGMPGDNSFTAGSTAAQDGADAKQQRVSRVQFFTCSDLGAGLPPQPDSKFLPSCFGGSAGAGSAGSVPYARGTTVCVAAVGRSEQEDEDEDSDDEVLVPIEDVLVPHPEDLMDPDGFGCASQLMHAASGCTIVSGPGFQLAEGLTGLLESMSCDMEGLTASMRTSSHMSTGTVSRLASNVLGLYQQHQQAMQQSPQQQNEQQQEWQEQQQRHNGTTERNARVNSCSNSRHVSSNGAAGTGGIGLQPEASTAGVPQAAATDTAAEITQADGDASTTNSGPPSALSIMAARPSAARFLRSISMVGSSSQATGPVGNVRPTTGALAAAGLLQLSVGCYVPTPHLLEKLLSRSAARGAPGLLTQDGTAAAARHRAHHCRFSSREALKDWSPESADPATMLSSPPMGVAATAVGCTGAAAASALATPALPAASAAVSDMALKAKSPGTKPAAAAAACAVPRAAETGEGFLGTADSMQTAGMQESMVVLPAGQDGQFMCSCNRANSNGASSNDIQQPSGEGITSIYAASGAAPVHTYPNSDAAAGAAGGEVSAAHIGAVQESSILQQQRQQPGLRYTCDTAPEVVGVRHYPLEAPTAAATGAAAGLLLQPGGAGGCSPGFGHILVRRRFVRNKNQQPAPMPRALRRSSTL